MQGKIQHALVLQKEGQTPVYKEFPIRKLADGELLIKVEATTINPSDRAVLSGHYPMKRALPLIAGLQGTGTVVEAHGEDVKSWIGKRVSFMTDNGSWSQYAIVKPISAFEIDKDIPLSSAASGVVNPLTVIGFVQHFRKLGGKGIIHTAAASSLGKMLNKLCLKQKIPLLNVVRRVEQAQILKKQGATHVVVTTGDWQKEFKQLVQKQGFNVVYDALGGGPVTEAIINNLNPASTYHLYGKLQKQPLTIHNPTCLFMGTVITSFYLTNWWTKTTKEVQQKVRKEYSALLKHELATSTFKELSLKDISEALELSVKHSTQGKILLKIV